MNAGAVLAVFLVALASVVTCAALLLLTDASAWAAVGLVSGVIAVGMALARPYVYRQTQGVDDA